MLASGCLLFFPELYMWRHRVFVYRCLLYNLLVDVLSHKLRPWKQVNAVFALDPGVGQFTSESNASEFISLDN